MKKVSENRKNSVLYLFLKYVSQNILGMIGISAYILADTFFISQTAGASGIAALNLVLPLYSIIFAIGSMIGTGAATRFKILRARNDERADMFFSNSVIFAVIISMAFVIMGLLVPHKLVEILGGDAELVYVGTPYTRIFLLFAPFFMINYICTAFVRNDNNPSLAMTATIVSSLFNIVMDYVFMFPLGMGMTGAALATAFSPVVGILVCCMHFFSKKSTVRFRISVPSVKMLMQSCQLGISAFVGEISSGVSTLVFNMLILSIAGNVGIAAFGVIANTAIVAVSVFNGIAQGSQPLFSDFYGKNNQKSVNRVLSLAVITAFAFAAVMIGISNLFAEEIVGVFNSENNILLAEYAVEGMKLYFIGYIFAGFNIVGAGYLSATECAGWAFAASMMRGFIAIVVSAVVMARLFGMTGIWLAFAAAELITAVVMFIAIVNSQKRGS